MQDSRTYTALALAGRSINDLLLPGDGIHPNAEGQHLVCEILTAQITR